MDVTAALGQFHRDHPFVRLRLHLSQSGASAYLADLGNEELVGFPPTFGAVHTPYEVPAGFAAIAELVRNGLGTTFMPASEADRFPDLRSYPLVQEVVWQVYLGPHRRRTG